MANAGTTEVDQEAVPAVSLDAEQFAKLEKDSQAVLDSMANDQSKQKVSAEYSKLLLALKTSYEN